MPGRCRKHHREPPPRRVPVLEARPDYFNTEIRHRPSSFGCQRASRLKAGDEESTPSQRESGLPSGTSDLEQWGARGEPCYLDKAVVQLAGILRPSPLIQSGRSIERRGETFALRMHSHGASLPQNAG